MPFSIRCVVFNFWYWKYSNVPVLDSHENSGNPNLKYLSPPIACILRKSIQDFFIQHTWFHAVSNKNSKKWCFEFKNSDFSEFEENFRTFSRICFQRPGFSSEFLNSELFWNQHKIHREERETRTSQNY